MTWKKWVLRILRGAGLAVLAVVLLAFAAVQTQQWLLRWRAERLMADMHQIRLYQSTWADAQRLMNRWGAWGHYDGSCKATSCRYEIDLMDACWWSQKGERAGICGWLVRNEADYEIYSLLGGRRAVIHCEFIVQDGTIWRTGAWVQIEAVSTLMAVARSRQVLRHSDGECSVFGWDNQLAKHPYYKAGHPPGTLGYSMAGITYSTHTPQSEDCSIDFVRFFLPYAADLLQKDG